MGVLALVTPDVGTLQGLPQTGNPVVIAANPRTGSYVFQFRPNDSLTIPYISSTEIYARIPFGVFDTRSTQFNIDFQNLTDGVVHTRFTTVWNRGGTSIYRGNGSTLLEHIGGNQHVPYVWNCFEFRIKISDTVGIFQVKADGVLIHDFYGDTKNGGTVSATDSIKIWTDNGIHMYYNVDDIMVRDDDWCGLGGIHLLTPDAAGDVSDWTASVGNAWETVDEVPPNFTDYIYEDSANLDTHLFNAISLPNEIKSVNAVKSLNVAKLSVTGSGSIVSAIKSGTTVASGVSAVLDTSDKYVEYILDDDPDTVSEWTVSGIANLQVGVEVV